MAVGCAIFECCDNPSIRAVIYTTASNYPMGGITQGGIYSISLGSASLCFTAVYVNTSVCSYPGTFGYSVKTNTLITGGVGFNSCVNCYDAQPKSGECTDVLDVIPDPTPTNTPTNTPTKTNTPTPTYSPTATNTPTPSVTASNTPPVTPSSSVPAPQPSACCYSCTEYRFVSSSDNVETATFDDCYGNTVTINIPIQSTVYVCICDGSDITVSGRGLVFFDPVGTCTPDCPTDSCDSYTITNNDDLLQNIEYTECFFGNNHANTIIQITLAPDEIVTVCSCSIPANKTGGNVSIVPNGPCVCEEVTPTPTASNTGTPTPTPSYTPTNTPTKTNTPTPTYSPTATNTPTFTNTPTNTGSPTPTYSPTATNTPTFTNTPTPTYSPTATNTPTVTNTPTPTYSPTATITPTVTNTPTCQLTTQYIAGEVVQGNKIRVNLWNDAALTSSATALCDYQVSGFMVGDQGFYYTGVRTFPVNDHQIEFNFTSILPPGEVISYWGITGVDTSACDCPVDVIFIPPTPTPTPTMSNTPTPGSSETPTPTPSITPTHTPTDTAAPTNTPTVSASITPTPSITQTHTPTVSASFTPTPSITPTHTPTDTAAPTNTPTVSASFTPTITPSRTPGGTPPVTPTLTPTETPGPTNTPTVTQSVSQTPSITPTQSVTATPTITPTLSPTPTVTISQSDTPGVSQTQTPTESVTPTPTHTPTESITPTPTVTPTVTASNSPTPSITASHTPTPTPSPTPDEPIGGSVTFRLFDEVFDCNTVRKLVACDGGTTYYVSDYLEYDGTPITTGMTFIADIVSVEGSGKLCLYYDSDVDGSSNSYVTQIYSIESDCNTCEVPVTPTMTPSMTQTPTLTPTLTVTPSNSVGSTPTPSPSREITYVYAYVKCNGDNKMIIQPVIVPGTTTSNAFMFNNVCWKLYGIFAQPWTPPSIYQPVTYNYNYFGSSITIYDNCNTCLTPPLSPSPTPSVSGGIVSRCTCNEYQVVNTTSTYKEWTYRNCITGGIVVENIGPGATVYKCACSSPAPYTDFGVNITLGSTCGGNTIPQTPTPTSTSAPTPTPSAAISCLYYQISNYSQFGPGSNVDFNYYDCDGISQSGSVMPDSDVTICSSTYPNVSSNGVVTPLNTSCN